MTVSSERFNLDLSEYALFKIMIYIFIYKKIATIFRRKMKIAAFMAILPKFSDFVNSDDCI